MNCSTTQSHCCTAKRIIRAKDVLVDIRPQRIVDIARFAVRRLAAKRFCRCSARLNLRVDVLSVQRLVSAYCDRSPADASKVSKARRWARIRRAPPRLYPGLDAMRVDACTWKNATCKRDLRPDRRSSRASLPRAVPAVPH